MNPRLDAESNASLKSQNGTKLSTGNESMATESVEAPVGRNRHRQMNLKNPRAMTLPKRMQQSKLVLRMTLPIA